MTNVAAYYGKVVVAMGSGGFDGPPSSCSVSNGAMLFWLDPTTPFGKTLLSLALSAKLSGKTIYATGDGLCSDAAPFPGVSSERLLGMDLKD